MLKRSLVLAGAAALVSSLLGAPIAADIIAYRTEDGVFAYTDDRAKVPARYTAEAVTVRDPKLESYPRLTIEDTASAREVSARLERRLGYLRQANAATVAEREVAASASAQQGAVVSGSAASPTLEVSADPAKGPIVVEPLRTQQDGRPATRTSTVVKQGDKVLAIVKSRSHHIDVNSDIHDDDEFEAR